MASGEMTQPEFTAFLKAVLRHLAAFSIDGAIHYQCMDWRHVEEMLAAGKAAYSELKNICVWAKTNGGMGSLHRSQHELVFVFKSGSAPHINNVDLGKHGRNRTYVWNHAGVNSFGVDRDDLNLHPTVKPVAMAADAIKDCLHRRGIVLEPFYRLGHYANRGRADRQTGLRHRDRPSLLRRDHSPTQKRMWSDGDPRGHRRRFRSGLG